MVATELLAFVRANLPAPPLRLLEVGAGDGALARALAQAGYEVLAIDPEPGGAGVRPVALHELDEPPASFDAAVAITSLHHVEPLDESLTRLARLLEPGGALVVDEFDVAAFDERAAAWWLRQRRALGAAEHASADELVGEHRAHLHPLERIIAALEPHFEGRHAALRPLPLSLGPRRVPPPPGRRRDRTRRDPRSRRTTARAAKPVTERWRSCARLHGCAGA
jgi:SAM-dependent methyltransferase